MSFFQDFETDLNKNNVQFVIQQIYDNDEVDSEAFLSELLSFENRWEALNSWKEERRHLLRGTLENWKAFRGQEQALVAWMDKKDQKLKALDSPVNLAHEKAVQQRLQELKVTRHLLDIKIAAGLTRSTLIKH